MKRAQEESAKKRGSGSSRPGSRPGLPGRPGMDALAGADNSAEDESKKHVVDPNGSYLEAAKQSFKNLNEDAGMKYLYAHALTADDGIENFPLSWVSSLKEPRLAVRWGVGIIYEAPDEFEGKPPVVGDTPGQEDSSSRDRGRGGARGQMPVPTFGGGSGRGSRGGNPGGSDGNAQSPYANVDTSTPNGALLYYTGDFGERLLKRLDSRRRHKTAFYGKILKEMPTLQTKAAQSSNGSDNARPQRNAGSGANKRGIMMGAGGMPPGMGGGPPTGRRGRDNNSTDNSDFSLDDIETGTLLPGVMLVGAGEGKSSEKGLIEKAKEMGVDFLITVRVKVYQKRNQAPYSTTYATVINCKDPKVRKKCGSLNSESVYEARQKQKSDANDKVELALDRLFSEFADKEFRTSEMPTKKLTQNVVSARVTQLADKSSDNPLPTLLEIAYYYSEGMATEEIALSSFAKIVGDENAAKLLTGSEKEKRAAIKAYMPDHGESAVSSDSTFR